jgi:hypothetical protein
MKSSQQKKLSLLTPKRLPAGFIAAAVVGLGMMGLVLGQQAPAPPTRTNPTACATSPASHARGATTRATATCAKSICEAADER